VGAETQNCSPPGMGQTIELGARLCTLSERKRSPDPDSTEGAVAVSLSAAPALYLYRPRNRAPACSRSSIAPAGGLRGWKYHCLFGLLSVSGLRISEALNLQLDDIDLRENVLTIQKTKFGKSRLVPLHPSTQKVLTGYLRQRSRFLAGRPASHLFVSGSGHRLNVACVRRTFHALSRQVGLRGVSASRGPRLHDFRIALRLRRCCTGTALASRLSRVCPSCRLTLG
jgi:integrase